MAKQKNPNKGLQDFARNTQELFKKQEFKFFVYGLAAFIILMAGSLYYLETTDFFKYPQVNKQEFAILETNLDKTIKTAKKNPQWAITELEALETMPKLLENRKHYILSKLYQKLDEPALAFMHAYDIDRSYLTKYSLSMRSKIAEKIGLEAVVVRDLDYLAKKYPKEPKFLYELSKSYSRQNRLLEAKKIFNKIQEQFPDSNYALGSDYYLANLTKNPGEKTKRFRNYITKSPDGSLAYLIADQIQNIEDSNYDDLSNYIALSYFHREDYAKAIKFFKTEQDSPDLWLEAYAKSLIEQRRKTDARVLLMEHIAKISDLDKTAKLVELLCSAGTKYQAIANLKVLKNKLTVIKDKLLWEIATRTHSKEDYQLVYQNYPKSFYAAESMSRVFWKEYKRKNYHKAVEIFKQHWKTYPNTNSHPFVAFWAAKAYEKLNQADDAHAALQNLIIEHPRDYYGYRAQQILNGTKNWYKLPSPNQFLAIPDWDWPEVYSKDGIKELYGADVLELCNIGEHAFLLENETSEGFKFNKNFKMWLYAQAEDHLKAISTAYFSLDRDAAVDYKELKFQYAFPMPYADIVADEIGKNLKVDPLLAHSLIKQESRYQKDIVSKVGAIGLMQLMPYTARALARAMNMRPPRTNDLMDPEINIKLGIRYMEDVFRTFDNNMIHAIASYNAGPVAVKGWKGRFSKLDADEFIENIPYNETKNYVKRVLNNFWIYKELYG